MKELEGVEEEMRERVVRWRRGDGDRRTRRALGSLGGERVELVSGLRMLLRLNGSNRSIVRLRITEQFEPWFQ